jgi:TetR/AcrR family transcriptional regulator, transcriptional repressor for nem operon
MAGRPKIFTQEEVLGHAIDLFWRNGYEATSTEELLNKMKLNKGSLYNSFGNKRQLFVKAMDFFAEVSIRALNVRIAAAATPLGGIREFFLELASTDNDTHQKGCFMGNSLAELANIDEELKQRAIIHLKDMEKVFLKYIQQAKKSGELKSEETPETLARYLLNLWNGINISRRIYPRKDLLLPVIRLQLEVLR